MSLSENRWHANRSDKNTSKGIRTGKGLNASKRINSIKDKSSFSNNINNHKNTSLNNVLKINKNTNYTLVCFVWFFVFVATIFMTFFANSSQFFNTKAASINPIDMIIDVNLDDKRIEEHFSDLVGINCSFKYTTHQGELRQGSEETRGYDNVLTDANNNNIESSNYKLDIHITETYNDNMPTINEVDLGGIYIAFNSLSTTLGITFNGFSIYYPINDTTNAVIDNTQHKFTASGKLSRSNMLINTGDAGNHVYGYVLRANWQVTNVDIEYRNEDNTVIDTSTMTNGGNAVPTKYKGETIDLSNVVASKTDYNFGGWYTSTAYLENERVVTLSGDYSNTIILYAKWIPTRADVVVNITIEGEAYSGVIIYLLKDGVMQSQAYAVSGETIDYNQRIGESYTLLICKPYMWTVTSSGIGVLNGVNYSYTVNQSNNVINLHFCGSSRANNIVFV